MCIGHIFYYLQVFIEFARQEYEHIEEVRKASETNPAYEVWHEGVRMTYKLWYWTGKSSTALCDTKSVCQITVPIHLVYQGHSVHKMCQYFVHVYKCLYGIKVLLLVVSELEGFHVYRCNTGWFQSGAVSYIEKF